MMSLYANNTEKTGILCTSFGKNLSVCICVHEHHADMLGNTKYRGAGRQLSTTAVGDGSCKVGPSAIAVFSLLSSSHLTGFF